MKVLTAPPDVATIYNNLGIACWKSGDKAKAVECMTKAVAIAERTLGKDHPNTKQFVSNLDYMKKRSGKQHR